MNTIERSFFHYFMSAQICSVEEASKLFNALRTSIGDEELNLKDCVESINNVIKCFDLEIVRGRSELDGYEAIALVQICENNVAECAKFHDAKISALFSKLISKIVLSNSGFISEISCVNLNNDVEMTKTSAQVAIDSFIAQKWLEVKQGNVYLGVRTLLELEQLLSSRYPDAFKQCPLCRNVLFYGAICHSCHSKSHIYCLRKYMERTATCPSCKNAWIEEIPSLDRDIPSTSNITEPSRAKRPRLLSD